MKTTSVFVFDAETDGLYGRCFAVGWAILTKGSTTIHRDGAQVHQPEISNQWVKDNVLPHLDGVPQVKTYLEMRERFWKALRDAMAAGCTIWADCGSPVESGLIRECVADDPSARQFDGPYPLHEVATLLLARGVDPQIPRFGGEWIGGLELKQHNPIDDAVASGLLLLRHL